MNQTETLQTDELESARERFRDELVAAGLLVPMGIDGLYGRGEFFEDTIERIDSVVVRKGREVHGNRPTRLRFPPLFSREDFERTDYIASFPNLTGSVSSFSGGNKEHRALLADRDAGRSWDSHLSPAETMLVSSACHPCYATLPSVLPESGALIDLYGYCFRHEPAIDPARMQAFRMHEYVLVGTPEEANQHRDSWIDHGLAVLRELGLDATPVAANDPFFGRAGQMLATNQLTENLKTELTVPLYGDLTEVTAVVSSNCHRDHFGETFDIKTSDGAVAHSACVGFGMERIALAMFRSHGLDRDDWPTSVCAALGL